jgi:hypothetical protein
MAKTVQLIIEYDPQPPFDSGSRSKATVERIVAASEGSWRFTRRRTSE